VALPDTNITIDAQRSQIARRIRRAQAGCGAALLIDEHLVRLPDERHSAG